MQVLNLMTVPFSKLKCHFLLIMLVLSIASCKRANNDSLNGKFEKEFIHSISNSHATFYEYRYDELTPQSSYFVNSKLLYLKFRDNPEAGFYERWIYFNSKTDSVEKFVLRVVQPEWKTYNDTYFDKYFDTIYVIYPGKELTLAYTNNKLCDSVFRPNINRNEIDFIYKMKKDTEQKYSSR